MLHDVVDVFENGSFVFSIKIEKRKPLKKRYEYTTYVRSRSRFSSGNTQGGVEVQADAPQVHRLSCATTCVPPRATTQDNIQVR